MNRQVIVVSFKINTSEEDKHTEKTNAKKIILTAECNNEHRINYSRAVQLTNIK